MTPNKQIPAWFDERVEALLAGELETLEGEQEAVELWNYLKVDRQARAQYDVLVKAMRTLAKQTGVKSFHDAEADALWPIVTGLVSDDARRRTGLSKQALSHLAVPELVASITNALTQFSQGGQETNPETSVFSSEVSQSSSQELDFSIASVGGEVVLRLYNNDELDVRCRFDGDKIRSNVSAADVENWEEVTAALNQLSQVTASLLGEEVLVNGRIAIRDGRAEVHVSPIRLADKK